MSRIVAGLPAMDITIKKKYKEHHHSRNNIFLNVLTSRGV